MVTARLKPCPDTKPGLKPDPESEPLFLRPEGQGFYRTCALRNTLCVQGLKPNSSSVVCGTTEVVP
jgi:hypothetical protein